jgi:hypothetical protein
MSLSTSWVVALFHAQLFQAEQEVALLQNTHHHALAVGDRE